MSDFWMNQNKETKNQYIELLSIIGSLSNLFSESSSPFLYYRAHENLFCHTFDAKNLSRGDISFDAVKDNVGIGLKTFLNNNGKTFQKVAEFNNNSDIIRSFDRTEDIVYKIAELRNKRITTTQNMTDTRENIYHLVTREAGKMNIIETPMELVDINSIRIADVQGKNTIKFSDKYNDYSFSLSKNTLKKRFDTTSQNIIYSFNVDILDNPFTFLEKQTTIISKAEVEKAPENNFIILPLYSPSKDEVQEKSGLNYWNASGRPRHPNEVYIPIPAWIHNVFDDFFVYSKEREFTGQSAGDSPHFQVELPSGKVLKCKIAQQGGKALMSDPNKDLGKWILRDVLNIPEYTILTKDLLEEIGVDSVRLTKKNDNYYYLDFVEVGTYELFEENNK